MAWSTSSLGCNAAYLTLHFQILLPFILQLVSCFQLDHPHCNFTQLTSIGLPGLQFLLFHPFFSFLHPFLTFITQILEYERIQLRLIPFHVRLFPSGTASFPLGKQLCETCPECQSLSDYGLFQFFHLSFLDYFSQGP